MTDAHREAIIRALTAWIGALEALKREATYSWQVEIWLREAREAREIMRTEE